MRREREWDDTCTTHLEVYSTSTLDAQMHAHDQWYAEVFQVFLSSCHSLYLDNNVTVKDRNTSRMTTEKKVGGKPGICNLALYYIYRASCHNPYNNQQMH
jgi:hypothetical protein